MYNFFFIYLSTICLLFNSANGLSKTNNNMIEHAITFPQQRVGIGVKSKPENTPYCRPPEGASCAMTTPEMTTTMPAAFAHEKPS